MDSDFSGNKRKKRRKPQRWTPLGKGLRQNHIYKGLNKERDLRWKDTEP